MPFANCNVTQAVRRREPFSFDRFIAYVKLWSWNLLTKFPISIVYLALISQGLKYTLPDIGLKLYKVPGFAALEYYDATYRLDLSHIFSFVPLVLAWISWYWLLQMYLRPDAFEQKFQRWDIDRVKRIVVTMGAIVIGGDALLFTAAFTLSGWSNKGFSIAALLATAVYMTVVAFCTFISIGLADALQPAPEQEKKQ